MIDYWFPTKIYYDNLSASFDTHFNQRCYDLLLSIKKDHRRVVGWNCDTYSTLDVVRLENNNDIMKLIDTCKFHVNKFSESYGLSSNIECVDCWGNIAGPGQHQERHIHPMSHFSLIYYVKCPENCGKTLFFSPFSDNMFPLPTIKNDKDNCLSCYYNPIESNILIFRSDMPHMVEFNRSHEDRCTISMNFVCK